MWYRCIPTVYFRKCCTISQIVKSDWLCPVASHLNSLIIKPLNFLSGCSLEFKWPLMFHFWNSAIITRRGESPAKTNGITSSFRSSCGSWRTMIWRVWPSSTRSSTSTRCSASRISSWLLTWWRASRYCATRRRARRCLLSAGWGGNATTQLNGWSLSQTQTSVISSIPKWSQGRKQSGKMCCMRV